MTDHGGDWAGFTETYGAPPLDFSANVSPLGVPEAVRQAAEAALAEGAIDGIADDAIFAQCDLLIPVLYPEATIRFLRKTIPLMKRGAQVVDLVGVKQRLVAEIAPTALACGGGKLHRRPSHGGTGQGRV